MVPLKFDPESIFPLRLSPFEEYFFIDNRSAYPMSENNAWFFRGAVNPALLEETFQEAASYEPFLFASVRKRRGIRRGYDWVYDEKKRNLSLAVTKVATPLLRDSGIIPLDRFDPTGDELYRFHLVIGPDGFILHTIFHHSLTDGLGTVRFVSRWLSLYDNRLRRERNEPEVPPPHPPIPEQLREREDFHIEYPREISFFRKSFAILKRSLLWFARRPYNLTPVFRRSTTKETVLTEGIPEAPFGTSPVPGTEEAFRDPTRPRIFWRALPTETFLRYRTAAKAAGVSLNSLLVRDFLTGLTGWLEEIGVKPSRHKHLKILVPTNLRNEKHHHALPMANMVGYVFIDRKPGSPNRSDVFLREIDDEIRRIREWSIGVFFLKGIQFFRKIPGAIRLMTAKYFCYSTLVFSNIGELSRGFSRPDWNGPGKTITFVDGTELVKMIGSPPVRPNTPVSIGVVSLQGEMVIEFCVDPTVVTESDRNRLFFRLVEEIETSGKATSPETKKTE